MTKEKDRWQRDAWKEAVEVERVEVDDQIKEIESANDIPFTWEGERAVPWEDKTIIKAFELAGKKNLLEEAKPFYDDFPDRFYITDVAQSDGEGGSSGSLSSKYGNHVRLEDGIGYFLCRS